jgi:SCY1-like protein 2
MQRVFPSLCKECVNHNMIPFVLPNMMLIAEQASEADYLKIVFPAFVPLFKINEPLQVMHSAFDCIMLNLNFIRLPI